MHEKLGYILSKMKELNTDSDIEVSHINADALLAQALIALVSECPDTELREVVEKIIEAYNDIEMFYA